MDSCCRSCTLPLYWEVGSITLALKRYSIMNREDYIYYYYIYIYIYIWVWDTVWCLVELAIGLGISLVSWLYLILFGIWSTYCQCADQSFLPLCSWELATMYLSKRSKWINMTTNYSFETLLILIIHNKLARNYQNNQWNNKNLSPWPISKFISTLYGT